MPRPSPDEAALLKAVCRAPADDLPRLVYADWLEEHGREERAEFIRLQIEAERDAPDSGRWERQKRIYDLHRDHAPRWLRELPRWAVGGSPPSFVRGFPERFEVVASLFLRYGPRLLDRTPVRAVRLTQFRNVVLDLAQCVWLREVPEVDLSGGLAGDRLALALASAEWLVGTRVLDLSMNNLFDAAARSLANCRLLSFVEVLRLRTNRLTEDGVQALAGSPYLDRHATIDLRGNAVLDDRPEIVRRILGPRGLV
jgi:uncharacterized protein (TIGR02996 family)